MRNNTLLVAWVVRRSASVTRHPKAENLEHRHQLRRILMTPLACADVNHTVSGICLSFESVVDENRSEMSEMLLKWQEKSEFDKEIPSLFVLSQPTMKFFGNLTKLVHQDSEVSHSSETT